MSQSFVEFGDVAIGFSQEEWEWLNPAQRTLWKRVVWENHSDLGASEHCVSKPDFVSLLEEGKEPWMGRRDVTGGLFSLESSGNSYRRETL
uniref:KRAB domain-containing protein n=1 Tax=Oryctolagus cuniculus TaxID=9986 RepID=A0A5F9D0L0_RABIT